MVVRRRYLARRVILGPYRSRSPCETSSTADSADVPQDAVSRGARVFSKHRFQQAVGIVEDDPLRAEVPREQAPRASHVAELADRVAHRPIRHPRSTPSGALAPTAEGRRRMQVLGRREHGCRRARALGMARERLLTESATSVVITLDTDMAISFNATESLYAGQGLEAGWPPRGAARMVPSSVTGNDAVTDRPRIREYAALRARARQGCRSFRAHLVPDDLRAAQCAQSVPANGRVQRCTERVTGRPGVWSGVVVAL